MKFNCKIILKDDVIIKDIEGNSQIEYGNATIGLNQTEKMILDHFGDFELKEISIILREFYQMDSGQANQVIEEFVDRLNGFGIIDIVDNCLQPTVDGKMLFIQNSAVDLIVDDDETGILRDFDKGKMLFINKSGIMIWRYLEQPHNLDNILLYFESIYNVNKEVLESDVKEFIQTLIDKKFLLITENVDT